MNFKTSWNTCSDGSCLYVRDNFEYRLDNCFSFKSALFRFGACPACVLAHCWKSFRTFARGVVRGVCAALGEDVETAAVRLRFGAGELGGQSDSGFRFGAHQSQRPGHSKVATPTSAP